MKLAAAVIAVAKNKGAGGDKAQLKQSGRALQLRHLEALDVAGFEPLVLNAFVAPDELPGWVSLVPDDKPGQGPLEGLASILRRMDRPVLVAASDMPGLDKEAFLALAQAYRLAPGLGLVAQIDGVWHPHFAVYHPDLLPHLETALQKGEATLVELIESLGLTAWAPPNRAWLSA